MAITQVTIPDLKMAITQVTSNLNMVKVYKC